MMISSSTAAVVTFTSHRSANSALPESDAPAFGPDYQVELSPEGLALSNSASGITESKMRNVLTRILLETLFGAETEALPDETAEEEMVREVVLDPLLEEQLQEIA
ncbi:MAG: hypothetical protein HQM00_04470 [Magnetococcales bacterium]|nr:hypothetical protein [Magnetococcales bacterium]